MQHGAGRNWSVVAIAWVLAACAPEGAAEPHPRGREVEVGLGVTGPDVGSAPIRVPLAPPDPEVCDGVDNDRDEGVDEGCAEFVAVGPPATSLGGYGNPAGGTWTSDVCPEDSALVGVRVVTDSYLRQIRGLCAQVALATDTTEVPFVHTIVHGGLDPLPNRGTWPGETSVAECPPGEFVVGMTARTGLLVDQITLACAPLELDGDIGEYALVRGPVEVLAPVGGTGGAAQPGAACPDADVVTELSVRTGDGLDYVELTCATPELVTTG